MRTSSTQIRSALERMLRAKGGLKYTKNGMAFVPRGHAIDGLSRNDGFWIGRSYPLATDEQVIEALDQVQQLIFDQRMPKRSALLRLGVETPWQMWSDRPFHELVDEEARKQLEMEQQQELLKGNDD